MKGEHEMKKFEKATIDIEKIDVEDVITTSVCEIYNENETDTDWD